MVTMWCIFSSVTNSKDILFDSLWIITLFPLPSLQEFGEKFWKGCVRR